MRILQLLAEKETAIHQSWLNHVFNEFQPEAVRFLKNKDRFANPLGHSFADGLRRVFQSVRSAEPGDLEPVLEHLMKLRAVQKELAPSAALAFIFELKRIIRRECRQEWTSEIEGEWPEVASRIDQVALTGFDLYMASRERLFQVRLRELQSGRSHLIDRAKCPSAIMREEIRSKQQAENDGNLNHSQQDAR